MINKALKAAHFQSVEKVKIIAADLKGCRDGKVGYVISNKNIVSDHLTTAPRCSKPEQTHNYVSFTVPFVITTRINIILR